MKIHLSSSIVIGYMMLAFCWWAIFLWRSNDRELQLQTELLRLKTPEHTTSVFQTPEYQAILQKHTRYEWMIIAEGMFFSGCLMFGLQIIRRTAQKEVKITRQKRNFLLSITHELKSPIAAIRLVLETFAKRTLTKEQSEQLSSGALRDAARLQNLVQDLLLAARLEDSWSPMPESISLHTLVQDCTGTLKIRFPNAAIVNQVPANLPPLQADKSGLTSVILNLIENALKYDPSQSPVTVSAEHVKGRTIIKVADQGQGIPAHERKSVFEKFYRLGNEETRQAKGTGLGLYIVQQVISAHGGKIEIADNKPNGTVFILEIGAPNALQTSISKLQKS